MHLPVLVSLPINAISAVNAINAVSRKNRHKVLLPDQNQGPSLRPTPESSRVSKVAEYRLVPKHTPWAQYRVPDLKLLLYRLRQHPLTRIPEQQVPDHSVRIPRPPNLNHLLKTSLKFPSLNHINPLRPRRLLHNHLRSDIVLHPQTLNQSAKL